MKMSEEMAVRLHRMMWSDMQRELGDCPTPKERAQFKFDWIHKHFPSESVANDCWLCEYASSMACRKGGDPYCKYCPISWPVNNHCNTLDFSYAKEPISDILALPAKNEKIMAKDDAAETVGSYYQYREDLLSKASGLPASLAIEDHVKAIQEKAMQQSTFSVMYCDAKTELAKASGRPEADGVASHIKAIQEKAVEEYFAKTPGAKLATMDVDKAFKQYADEQKAPIFRQLAAASGLDRNRPIDDHIREIVKNSMEAGAAEERDRIQEKIYEVLLS